jgi:hypothetical protein
VAERLIFLISGLTASAGALEIRQRHAVSSHKLVDSSTAL